MLKEGYEAALRTIAELEKDTGLVWKRAGEESYEARAGEAQFTVARRPEQGCTEVTAALGDRRNCVNLSSFPRAMKLWQQAQEQVTGRAATQRVLIEILGGSTHGLLTGSEAMPALVIALTNATREERVCWHRKDGRDNREIYLCEIAGITAELGCPGEQGVEFALLRSNGTLAGELRLTEPRRPRDLDLLRELRKQILIARSPFEPEEPAEAGEPEPEIWNGAMAELKKAHRERVL